MNSASAADQSATVRERAVASGLVQGVFFRDECRAEAVSWKVSGWVRNRVEGTVEAVFEGAQGAVSHMVEWMRHGPDRARVSDVQVFGEEPEGLVGFAVLPTAGDWRT
ncbi:acylphosphatase [Catenulispora subtropica]